MPNRSGPRPAPADADLAARLAMPAKLYGRDEALACLSQAWTEEPRRTPGWLVCGPPGIGRTALLEALEALARRSGHAGDDAATLIRFEAGAADDPDASVGRIRTARRGDRKVLLIDDLHHADAHTLTGIAERITHPGDGAAVCIASCTSTALQQSPALAALAARLQSGGAPGHVLTLGPLTEAATAAWLGEAIAVEARRLRALAAIVVAKTDGNPRDTLAFVAAACRDGLLVDDRAHGGWQWDAPGLRARPLADGVVDALLEALPELDHDAHALLLAGARLGERFATHAAMKHAGLAREAAADALDALLAHGFVRKEGAHMLAFQHPRLHQSAAALPPDHSGAQGTAVARETQDARPSDAVTDDAAAEAQAAAPPGDNGIHDHAPKMAHTSWGADTSIDLDSLLAGMEAIAREHDRGTLLERVMTTALACTGAERGAVLLTDADGAVHAEGWATCARDHGGGFAPAPPFGVPAWIAHTAAQAVRPLLIDDATKDHRLAHDPELRLRGVRALLCVPLLRRGVPMGALYLEDSRASGRFSQAQARTLALVASQAAVGLENARLYAEMEAQIRLRTAQLEEALALAEEATRAKSAFLANMSHEIRTPMNAIIGMSELAMQVDLGDRARGYVSKVHRAAENLLGIINEILDFSKIEAGMLTLEHAEFGLDEVLQHLGNLFAYKAAERGLELAFTVAPDVPTRLIGDALRLGQILTNLTNNAIKFTTTGGIVVGCSLVAREGARSELHCWVRDTGIGMTAEQCGRLFQSFSQAEASISRRFGGTGLGLAISKKMVEAMNGRIWVESRLGVGSTFHFQIRLGVPDYAPTLAEHPIAQRLLGNRVLVVDDEPGARAALAELTRSLGLECADAGSGALALELIARGLADDRPFDVVLLDAKMPGMDGYACAQHIATAHGARAPVTVLLAAPGQDDTRSRPTTPSAPGVVPKPVTPGMLLRALEHAVRGTVPQAEPVAAMRIAPHVMAHLRGLRVLLVEDNDMNQELAMALLLAAGIHVDLAENGLVALERLAGSIRYDGVLMDCQMPVMDGYTASRQIRANPVLRDLPVVAMTANATPDEHDKVLAAGMNDLLFKPLDVDTMFACITRWFAPQRRAVDARRGPASGEAPAVLQRLTGIDSARGLATSMNLTDLYRHQLQRFAQGSGRFASQFDDALRASDQAAMSLLAHTLKSSASSIGATELANAATELEAACLAAAPGERIERLRSATLAALARVQAALDALPKRTDGTRTAPASHSIAERIAALQRLVAESDAEAAAAAHELAAALPGSDARHVALRAVCEALQRFDYDAAEALLARLTAA